MSGQGFQFTPGGVTQLQPDAAVTQATGADIQAAIQNSRQMVSAPPQATQAETPRPTRTRPQPKAPEVLKRKSFVKQLEARLREVRRELKKLRALEEEEIELKRLIAAAKAPPAKIQDISTARKSS